MEPPKSSSCRNGDEQESKCRQQLESQGLGKYGHRIGVAERTTGREQKECRRSKDRIIGESRESDVGEGNGEGILGAQSGEAGGT